MGGPGLRERGPVGRGCRAAAGPGGSKLCGPSGPSSIRPLRCVHIPCKEPAPSPTASCPPSATAGTQGRVCRAGCGRIPWRAWASTVDCHAVQLEGSTGEPLGAARGIKTETLILFFLSCNGKAEGFRGGARVHSLATCLGTSPSLSVHRAQP